MFLGLDISRSIAGSCVIGFDGSILHVGSHVFSKGKNTWEKLEEFSEYFSSVRKEWNFKMVGVEAPKKQFSGGKTNSNTMIDLVEFNVLCRYEIYKTTEFDSLLINESQARKKLGILIKNKLRDPGGKKISSKQQTFDQVKQMHCFKDKKWDLKRTGKVKDYHYDEVDAFVIAKYLFLTNGKA